MRILSAAAALGFFACGEEPNAPPIDTPPAIVRPERVEALSVGTTRYSLPDALKNDPGLTISSLEASGTLIGGALGLHQISGDQIVAIDGVAVTALAAVEGAGIVVGREDGVSLWNGALIASPLTEAIGSMAVKSLLERSGALFIGTDAAFYLLEEGELFQFVDVGGASYLAGYAAGHTLVIDDLLVLKSDASGWSLQDLADELQPERTIPAAGDRLFAADGGALLERIEIEEGAVWRSVALTIDEADLGAVGVIGMATDPISGNAWIVTADRIAKIAGTSVATMDYPSDLAPPITMRATLDGALWISDGTTLVRFGDDDGPVTYANDIAAFSANNCERCHRPLGIGHELGSYEVWVEEVDEILGELDAMTMPQDGAPLVGGTVELIRAWKADGLLP